MSCTFHPRRGHAWHTALGFLALGFASALFGALVVGPRLVPGEGPAHAATGAPPVPAAPPRPKPAPARDVTRALAKASRAEQRKEAEQHEEKEERPAPAAEVEIREAPRADTPSPKAEEQEQPAPDRPAEEPKAADEKPRPAADAPAAEPAGSEAKPSEPTRFYRVSVGRFDTREEAQELRQELLEKTGKAAHLVQLADGFRVQMGAFRHRLNAERAAEELRSLNYRPRVILDRTPATQ